MPSITQRCRRQVVTSMLALSLSACTYWQAGTPTPAEFVSSKQPEQVRVIRADSSKFLLRNPSVAGDSLLGTAAGEAPGDTLRSVAIPLADVQRVEVKRTSVGNTVGFAVVSAAVVTFFAIIIECNNKEGFEKIDCP